MMQQSIWIFWRMEAELAGVEKADGTWHHHEDGVTLQEVETILHDRFRHRGGISNLKKK